MEQVDLLSTNEIKLRNQMANKDKNLFELNGIIKQYQQEVMDLKRKICLSEEKFSSLASEFSSTKNSCSKMSDALSNKEQEQRG